MRIVDVDGFVLRQCLVERIGVVDGTVFDAGGAARALVLDNVSGFFDQSDREVPCFPFDMLDFRQCQDLDVGVPADLDQFGREYSHRAVVGRKRLVQLGHAAADGR